MTEPEIDGLYARLVRECVSPRLARRAVEELRAHREDLLRNDASGAASLGSADRFVAEMAARPELRTWPRRWPWIAFVVLPPVAFVVAGGGLGLLMAGFVAVADLAPDRVVGPGWLLAARAFEIAFSWGLPMAVAVGTVVAARRTGVGVAWPLAGIGLIVLLGATTQAELADAGRTAMISAGHPALFSPWKAIAIAAIAAAAQRRRARAEG